MCLYLISRSLIVTQQVFPKFLLDKRLSFFFLFFKENLFYSICPFAFFPFSHMYFQRYSTLLRALSLYNPVVLLIFISYLCSNRTYPYLVENGQKFSFYFFKNFYCYSITVVCPLSPSLHPTPAEPTSLPTSTRPLGFVHVSFIVVPIIPSSHCPPPLSYCQIVL